MTTANAILAAGALALWTVLALTAWPAETQEHVAETVWPARYCLAGTMAGGPYALPCRDVFDEREA